MSDESLRDLQLRALQLKAQRMAAPPPDIAAPSPAAMTDPQPRPSPGFFERAATVAGGMVNELNAAVQGTSPVTHDLPTGKPTRPYLGEYRSPEMTEFGKAPAVMTPKGEMPFDPKTMVALLENGKLQVYQRTEDSDEGALSSVGRIVSAGTLAGPVSRLASRAPQTGQALDRLEDFRGAGVDPTQAGVNQGRGTKIVENTLGNMPTSAGQADRARQRSMQQTAVEAERIAEGYGVATNREQAGESVQRGAREFIADKPSKLPEADVIKMPTRATSFEEKAGKLYDRVDKHLPPQNKVPIQNTQAYLGELSAKFAGEPKIAAILETPLMRRFKDALAGDGKTVTYEVLKGLRSEIGRKLNKSLLVADENQAVYEAMYSNLSKDMEAAAKATGPAAEHAFRRANQYYRTGHDRIRNALSVVLKENQSGENVYAVIRRLAQEKNAGASASKLKALKRSMGDDAWGDFSSAFLRELGEPTASASEAVAKMKFSPTTFWDNYDKLSDQAKSLFFGGSGREQLRKELDRLVKVAGYQKDVEKLQNTSKTAPGVITGLSGIEIVRSLMSGDWGVAAAAAGAHAAAPVVASLYFNPKFVRWMNGLPPLKDRSQIAAHVAKLRLLAKMEPDIAPEIDAVEKHVSGQLGAPDDRKK